MDAMAVPAGDRPAPTAARLACPACAAPVRVSARQLISGIQVDCVQCGHQSEVTRAYDLVNGDHRWILVDPLVDLDEESGRRG